MCCHKFNTDGLVMVGLAEGKGLFFRRPYRKIAVLLVVVSWNTTPCTPYGYVCQLVGL